MSSTHFFLTSISVFWVSTSLNLLILNCLLSSMPRSLSAVPSIFWFCKNCGSSDFDTPLPRFMIPPSWGRSSGFEVEKVMQALGFVFAPFAPLSAWEFWKLIFCGSMRASSFRLISSFLPRMAKYFILLVDAVSKNLDRRCVQTSCGRRYRLFCDLFYFFEFDVGVEFFEFDQRFFDIFDASLLLEKFDLVFEVEFHFVESLGWFFWWCRRYCCHYAYYIAIHESHTFGYTEGNCVFWKDEFSLWGFFWDDFDKSWLECRHKGHVLW